MHRSSCVPQKVGHGVSPPTTPQHLDRPTPNVLIENFNAMQLEQNTGCPNPSSSGNQLSVQHTFTQLHVVTQQFPPIENAFSSSSQESNEYVVLQPMGNIPSTQYLNPLYDPALETYVNPQQVIPSPGSYYYSENGASSPESQTSAQGEYSSRERSFSRSSSAAESEFTLHPLRRPTLKTIAKKTHEPKEQKPRGRPRGTYTVNNPDMKKNRYHQNYNIKLKQNLEKLEELANLYNELMLSCNVQPSEHMIEIINLLNDPDFRRPNSQLNIRL